MEKILNLNSKYFLQRLAGIGPKTAQMVYQYREYGAYASCRTSPGSVILTVTVAASKCLVVSLLDLLLLLNMAELTGLAWAESFLLAVEDLEFRVLWRDTVGSNAVEYSFTVIFIYLSQRKGYNIS